MNRTYEDMSKKELVTLVKRLAKQHDEWSDEAKRLREELERMTTLCKWWVGEAERLEEQVEAIV